MFKLITLGVALATLPLPAAAMSVAQRIALPDGGWDYLSFDSAGNRVMIARTDGVATIDAATGAVVPQLVAAGRLHAAFVIPGTTIGVLTSTTSGGAMLFDAGTGKVTAEIKTGLKPDAAIYDAGSKLVFVMDNKDGTIAVVDPVAAKLVGTVAVGGALEFAAVDGHGHVFVNVEDKSELAMVDIAKRTVVRRTKLTGCEEPSGLAYTTDGVLIAACANNVAKSVEAKSGKVLADIAIGPRPDAVLYDAARDRAYIPSGGDGTLTVIDTARGHAPHAIDKVATQTGARTGAVDPKTGTVYLPTARYEPAVAGARPKVVAGSVEILVVR
jgi:DNA-binding beta-propeller fold protein YncE